MLGNVRRDLILHECVGPLSILPLAPGEHVLLQEVQVDLLNHLYPSWEEYMYQGGLLAAGAHVCPHHDRGRL